MRRLGAGLLVAVLTATLVVSAPPEPARAAALCATPGRDGTATNQSGIVDTYFPGSATAGAGAKSIVLGAHGTGDAGTAIAAGDLLLVVQMQGATIDTSNSASYGDGSTGSGATAVSAGKFEYVVAGSALATGGGTVTVAGTGAGGGLINTYTAGANARFQVVRVPQYTSASFGTATPLAWNGSTGGVFAVDVQGLLGGGTINANTAGFRGGLGIQESGNNAGTAGAYAAPAPVATPGAAAIAGLHGSKGEGIAGTPEYTYNAVAAAAVRTGTADGYPGGDNGRGAPGNAGGGGADAHPPGNDENTGGGGGGNGGAGGVGGKSWNSNLAYGGLGGTFTPAATQLVMGGGGGAGARNNGANADSSGGTGGGLVMIRIAGVSAATTITANGGSGVEPQNDGGAGAGAGGSIMITGTTALANVTVTANGGVGTNADVRNAGGAAHGPGGGGGGGVFVSNGGVAPTYTGGAAGTTDGSPTPDAHYGAAAGQSGQSFTLTPAGVPGASSGAECGSSPGTGILIGPVGVPNATGSYDGNAAVTNNDDFVEKSFAPAGFTAINASTTPGSPSGNAYGSAVGGIAVRHQVHNYGGAGNFIFFAQAPGSPNGWTVAVYADNAGAVGAPIAGTASGTTYQTTATVAIGAGADAFVWAVYAAPNGIVAFNRFDALLAVVDGGNVNNNNEVHDELYSGFVVQTKSYTITATGCGGAVPAGTWCPGGTLKYTIDVRNIAVPANGTTPASATLTANGLTLADDGTNANSWAKDGGYMTNAGVSATAPAPGTVTYYYPGGPSTTFPPSYTTTQKVSKFTALWPTFAAAAQSAVSFSAVQF